MSKVSWTIEEDLDFQEVWNVSGSPQIFEGEDNEYRPFGQAQGVLLPGPDPFAQENSRFFFSLDARDGADCLAAEMLLNNLSKVQVEGDSLLGVESFLLLEWLECDQKYRGKSFTSAMLLSLLTSPMQWHVMMLLARGDRLTSHWKRHGFTVIDVHHSDEEGPVSLLVADRYTLERLAFDSAQTDEG